MNKTLLLIVLILGGLMVGAGLLFLCAAMVRPERLALAIVLILVGGAGAAWAGLTWQHLNNIDPKRLADRIVEMVRSQGQFETTAAEAVAELAAPAASVQQALELLQSRGEAVPEQRDDRRVYVFPNLKESKVERRCPYCGVQFPVKQALTQCPNCGGNLELKRT
jgi:hypothetical protein